MCNATISETVNLGVSAGLRLSPEIACTGLLATDILVVLPTSLSSLTSPLGASNGYAVHHAIPTKAGAFKAVLMVPAIVALGSYSIPVAVYSLNR